MEVTLDRVKLIVKKHGPTQYDSTKGSVDIIFVIQQKDTGEEISVPDESFYTKGVFISGDYQEIDSKFKSNELFSITCKRSDDFDISNPHGKHDNWALGGWAKPLSLSEYLPIVNTSMPDVSTGEILSQKLPVEVRMSAKPFFINDAGFLYGPLVISKINQETSTLVQYAQTIVSLPTDLLMKLDEENLEQQFGVMVSSEDGKKYISSIKVLSRFRINDSVRFDNYDFISDDKLIDFYAKYKLGKKSSILSRKEAKTLKEGILEWIKKNEALKNDERFIRIQELLGDYLSETDIGLQVIEDYFTENKQLVEEFVIKTPQLLERIVPRETIDQLNSEVVELENKITQLNQQQQNQKNLVETEKQRAQDEISKVQHEANNKIAEIKSKTEEEIKFESQKKVEMIQTEIERKTHELDQKITELDAIEVKYNLAKGFEELKKENDFLERQNKHISAAVRKQENTLRNPELGDQLTEVKTIIDMLQGRSFNQGKQDRILFSAPRRIQNLPSSSNGMEFIQSIVEYFENEGYSWSFNQMANFLINVQQNFLTMLAGPPGTGKTSSVIKLMKSQYLCEKQDSTSDCFLNVSVGRGWMTARDTIGFYNSLKGVYQSSKTGIYQFLQKGETEEAKEFLRVILLDEANLSPIEHYWSDFIGMCDIEGRNKPIDTGMPDDFRYLNVPENIRFVATINNDSSTEPLSPRLIDRVPVMTIEEDQYESTTEIASWNVDGAVPFDFLESCFGKKDDDEIWSQVQIDEFCKVMAEKDSQRGLGILVSHRKLASMYSYYSRAIDYMDSNVAADFAISQHALPLINGHGTAFKERLTSLKEYADNNNLPKTSTSLERIIKSGEDYIDSYSFF